MARKRKTLPKEIRSLLECGNIEMLKEQFLRCEPNALTTNIYGSNIFSLSPLPREFAFWAKEHGADVNFIDYYGQTPIFYHASAWNGDVPLLIALGAKTDVAEANGVTPLHLAAVYGRTDAVKALLNTGVDANIKSGQDDRPGFVTPLEKTLLQNRLSYENLLEICEILLKRGGKITDLARESLRKSAENFQQTKQGIQSQTYLESQIKNLKKLYEMFDVEPIEESILHDGISPIHIPKQNESKAFQWLWNYLVPSSGKAQTAQGEIIRIAGRIQHEFLDNGCINWDEDFEKMLDAFLRYIQLGNGFHSNDLKTAEVLVQLLKDNGSKGFIDDSLTTALCSYAVAWVKQNPETILPLAADYIR